MGRMICDDVYLFYDDELPTERARPFALHLPDCPSCSREMRELAKFDAAAADVLLSGPKPTSWPAVALVIFLVTMLAWAVIVSERT